jgi:flagellar basal body-associated protein FliL
MRNDDNPNTVQRRGYFSAYNIGRLILIALLIVMGVVVGVLILFLHSGLSYEKSTGYPPTSVSLFYAMLWTCPFLFGALLLARIKERLKIIITSLCVIIIAFVFVLSLPNTKKEYTEAEIQKQVSMALNHDFEDRYEYEIVQRRHYDEGEVGWSDFYTVKLIDDHYEEFIKKLTEHEGWVSEDDPVGKYYTSYKEFTGRGYKNVSLNARLNQRPLVEVRLFQQKKSYY